MPGAPVQRSRNQTRQLWGNRAGFRIIRPAKAKRVLAPNLGLGGVRQNSKTPAELLLRYEVQHGRLDALPLAPFASSGSQHLASRGRIAGSHENWRFLSRLCRPGSAIFAAMNEDDIRRPLYPLDQAFVVQIHQNAASETGRLYGRVEHVSSWQDVEFGDAEALLRFISGLVRRC